MKRIQKDKDIKKILFITLSNIGDAILTTPTLEALHFKYPNAVFDIVGDKRSRILFKYCPYMNNFMEKDKSLGWYGILSLIRKIRQERYDLAVDLRSDLLLYFIKSKKFFFKASNNSTLNLHSVEKHFLSIKSVIQDKPPSTKIWLSDYESETSRKIFDKYSNTRFLALGLGANFNGKIWDVSKFVDLAKSLKDTFGGIILVGDQKDAALSKKFISEYKGIVINCCGHYNLLETAAIIKKSNFFVGNDSGLGHIASAVGIKSFTIFGIGTPNRYRPWGKNAFWIQDKNYEINNVDSKTIAKEIIQVLN
jgi:ADP-heptose:LPS heptosyltransferase